MSCGAVKIFFLVFLCSFLSACLTQAVSEQRNPLDIQYQEFSLLDKANLKINSTHVAVGTHGHRNVDFVRPGQNQAGLVGFFVNALVTSSANSDIQDQERLIQPTRNAMLKYNYSSKLRAAVERRLGTMAWLNVSYVAKYPGLQKNNVENLLEKNSDDTLLIVDSGYSFAPDYNSIRVICYTAIHSRNKYLLVGGEEKNSDTLVYQKKFSYTYRLDKVYDDRNTAIKRWSENEGSTVVQALNAALVDITQRMAVDIGDKKS